MTVTAPAPRATRPPGSAPGLRAPPRPVPRAGPATWARSVPETGEARQRSSRRTPLRTPRLTMRHLGGAGAGDRFEIRDLHADAYGAGLDRRAALRSVDIRDPAGPTPAAAARLVADAPRRRCAGGRRGHRPPARSAFAGAGARARRSSARSSTASIAGRSAGRARGNAGRSPAPSEAPRPGAWPPRGRGAPCRRGIAAPSDVRPRLRECLPARSSASRVRSFASAVSPSTSRMRARVASNVRCDSVRRERASATSAGGQPQALGDGEGLRSARQPDRQAVGGLSVSMSNSTEAFIAPFVVWAYAFSSA